MGRGARELERAREIRPLIEDADFLLDLHSMQSPAPPLLLTGVTDKGRRLAAAMGPGLHRRGRRPSQWRAHARFRRSATRQRTAVLVECGQHWAKRSVRVAIAACRQFLAALEVVETRLLDRLGSAPALGPQRVVEVTQAVTVADGRFRFTRTMRSGSDPQGRHRDRLRRPQPIRTPYDGCVLIMPSRRLARGFTAVRLGRFVE